MDSIFIVEGDVLITIELLVSMDDPYNYKDVIEGLEAAKWKQHIESEIHYMYENNLKFG